MKGYVYVDPAGIAEDTELDAWLSACVGFVERLPVKPHGDSVGAQRIRAKRRPRPADR